ncbi:hypothetical protein Q5P01_010772 [Channa striata]|uniref:Uncharacterized protein n=1 Tax=Channa striata TaxID=64152 RepID=A0AA88MVR6_CHASR|nr:hypothetical protein Q5P01_010772 [Channa striata]
MSAPVVNDFENVTHVEMSSGSHSGARRRAVRDGNVHMPRREMFAITQHKRPWCDWHLYFPLCLLAHLSPACHGESSCTMSLVRGLSKIHTTDLFEVVPEPNIVAHITEQNSHFPWQQKTERQREEENSHLKQLRPFSIHERGDCGGSHKVWDIKPPNKHRGGCHPCMDRPYWAPCASWIENAQDSG